MCSKYVYYKGEIYKGSIYKMSEKKSIGWV